MTATGQTADSASAWAAGPYDLLLQGGHVIDPATGSMNGAVLTMLRTVSKCLNCGMSLTEAVYRSTVTPARAIRRPDLGTLRPGAEADVAVLRLHTGEFGYTDCGRARMHGTQQLECVLTLRAGQIVYDPDGLTMPDWEQAPAPYWEIPNLQT